MSSDVLTMIASLLQVESFPGRLCTDNYCAAEVATQCDVAGTHYDLWKLFCQFFVTFIQNVSKMPKRSNNAIVHR